VPYAIADIETLHDGWTKILRATVRYRTDGWSGGRWSITGPPSACSPYDPTAASRC
jgi:hypothetical protein